LKLKCTQCVSISNMSQSHRALKSCTDDSSDGDAQLWHGSVPTVVDPVDNDEPVPISSRTSWPLLNPPQPQSEREQQPDVNGNFNDDPSSQPLDAQQELDTSRQQAPPCGDADDVSTDSVQEAKQRADKQILEGKRIRKRFKCPKCKRKIADSRGYHKHVIDCPDKCPFKCPKCGWRFNSAQTYTRHLRSECAKGTLQPNK
jgi:uncharacterized C2H2 Zn-finger protein